MIINCFRRKEYLIYIRAPLYNYLSLLKIKNKGRKKNQKQQKQRRRKPQNNTRKTQKNYTKEKVALVSVPFVFVFVFVFLPFFFQKVYSRSCNTFSITYKETNGSRLKDLQGLVCSTRQPVVLICIFYLCFPETFKQPLIRILLFAIKLVEERKKKYVESYC